MASKTDTLKQLNESLNRRMLLIQHVYMATTVTAYLAFTWSTVVLLGGYVTSLEKKDFWCLTMISLAEAASIFNDMEADQKLKENIISFMLTSFQTAADIAKDCLPIPADSKHGNKGALYLLKKVATVLCTGILMAPIMVVIFSILILMMLSPFLFVSLPAWRLRQHDYGVTGGDSNKASLEPALDIFYSLVLVQGVLSMLVGVTPAIGASWAIYRFFFDICKFPQEWCLNAAAGYIQDIAVKSRQDLQSVQQASVFSHASELLGSESWNKYIAGVMMLGTLAKQGMEDPIFTVFMSKEKIQRLISTLGLSQSSTIQVVPEMREHAARIVAGFAEAIHLAQFPGAARCISTLLEDTGVVDYSSELIVQGLAILEKLALNHDNCREICGTPGLLRKIMVPICSGDLTQDTRIARSRVVSGTFKVLRGLTRVPGKAGRRLRREISCNKQAVSNLESIILDEAGQAGDELQMLALEILLELVGDESIKLSGETIPNVIKKLLQIFLADGMGEAAAGMFDQQKFMAGKALRLLSNDSKSNSTIMMEAHRDTLGCLIEILDAKNNIMYRVLAIRILKNLCTHCALDEERLKETLLPKVLSEIMTSKTGQQIVSPQAIIPSAQGDDEEKQNLKERRDGRDEKDETKAKELLQEAFQEILLSLTLELYDSVGADSFTLAVQQEAPGDGAFVANLKTIVEKSCDEATRISLDTVKLCCRIAISMLRRNQYTAHFKDLEFMESVSKASEMMYELDSCIRITSPKNTRTPLLSELERKLKQELGLVR